ncbi:hypothetical protein FRC12_005830 [Ceratobasidium sp. 428]|nr:hypothetical protein FRC12_005830 [Ceratobasidium sp. 428]
MASQGTDSKEDPLNGSGAEQLASTTKYACPEMTELIKRLEPITAMIEPLLEELDPERPVSNDLQENNQSSSTIAPVSPACDQTVSEGLGGAEHTKPLSELREIHVWIDGLTEIVEITPDDRPSKPGWLNMLGLAYELLFNHQGALEHIRMAVTCIEAAVALAPNGDPHKPRYLKHLGDAHQSLFCHLGELEDLRVALDCQTQAVALTPESHSDRPACLNGLGIAYEALYCCLGELGYVSKAINCWTQAVALAPKGHPEIPSYHSNLGNAYQSLFCHLGELEHLYMALDYQQQGAALSPDDDPNKPRHLTNLGNTYRTLFNRLGELDHIRMAVDCQKRAVALTPNSNLDKSGLLNNLGVSYRALFDHLGEIEHLHMAVDCMTQAIVLTPAGHPQKPSCLNNLGNTYMSLFNRLGELEHICMAIDCGMQAVALTPDSHPSRPGYLSNLGSAYQTLFTRLGELEHLRMAVDFHKQAVALTPEGHPEKPGRLNNLAMAFEILFDHLGELEHLSMVISCLTQAVALAPDGCSDKSSRLSNLGGAYQRLFKCQAKLEDLRMAVDCEKQAMELTPEESSSKAQYLSGLGYLYWSLFNASDEPEHIIGAELYSQCATLSPTGHPIVRFQAARFWAWLSSLNGSDTLEAYSHCMMRLPEVVWLGTSVRRRFECLASDVQGLVSDAAVAAILGSRYDLAVEWLEQGRCLIWGQMLQLRTPLDELRASHPELADELYFLSSRLEDGDSSAQNCSTSSIPEALSRNDTYMHGQLADRRERLIDKIRLQPGFNDFLRPPKASTIVSHMRHGATVILTAHESPLVTDAFRCDAIVIEPGAHAIAHVALPSFSHHQAEQLRQELLLCLKSQGIARGFKKDNAPLQTSFRSMLATLWSLIVKPVLDHLNISRILPIDDLPHITWCITGPLSFLPVHAAGIYDDPSTVLSNLAISSYTPTVSSIGRSCSTPPTFSGILAVGHQSSVRGLSPLPGTKDELDRVEEQFANRRFTRLEEGAATMDAVVKAMEYHSLVHFACHGSQDPLDPMNSALHLHDKDLSLAAISRLSIKNAQLAFLSVCQTAKGDSELPNEAVHLAAGLLIAGYANVIATMWSIKDQDAPIVAGEVYKCMLEGGVPDSRKAAKALHRAVKHLQDAIGVNEFARWVPYIHMGG